MTQIIDFTDIEVGDLMVSHIMWGNHGLIVVTDVDRDNDRFVITNHKGSKITWGFKSLECYKGVIQFHRKIYNYDPTQQGDTEEDV